MLLDGCLVRTSVTIDLYYVPIVTKIIDVRSLVAWYSTGTYVVEALATDSHVTDDAEPFT